MQVWAQSGGAIGLEVYVMGLSPWAALSGGLLKFQICSVEKRELQVGKYGMLQKLCLKTFSEAFPK